MAKGAGRNGAGTKRARIAATAMFAARSPVPERDAAGAATAVRRNQQGTKGARIAARKMFAACSPVPERDAGAAACSTREEPSGNEGRANRCAGDVPRPFRSVPEGDGRAKAAGTGLNEDGTNQARGDVRELFRPGVQRRLVRACGRGRFYPRAQMSIQVERELCCGGRTRHSRSAAFPCSPEQEPGRDR